MKPTVGRIVHFYPPSVEPAPDRGDGPYAGIITRVCDPVEAGPGYVDLVTFGTGSIYFHELVAFTDHMSPGGYTGLTGAWTWPPRES